VQGAFERRAADFDVSMLLQSYLRGWRYVPIASRGGPIPPEHRHEM
jgi:hypothetical protein